ncbi:MAG: S1 family peptidase [Polyangiales bacterium]
MKRALLVVALTTACASSDRVERHASSVVKGTRTSGDPSVVAILARRARCVEPDPTLLCTGTLVAPKVVLTAAHCLEAFGEEGAYEVVFGPSLDAPDARFVWVRRAKSHPGYVADTHENDVAVMELDEAGPSPPVLSAQTPLDAIVVGATARVVGFGETRDSAEPVGFKRTGDTTISKVSEKDFEATPGPSMSCSGDSGGPVFVRGVDGVEELAGVTVKGDPACKTFAVALRVDAYWSSFVQPFVDEVAAAKPDPTPTIALDGICRESCGPASVCPLQMQCLPDDDGTPRCTTPSMGAGTIAGACTRDDQCGDGGQCARIAATGADACACFHPCHALVEPDAGVDAAASPTIHAAGGGCSIGRAPRVSLFAVLFAVVLVSGRRRRLRGGSPGS